MDSKRILLIACILLIAGCLYETRYVCQGGMTVDNPKLCEADEPETSSIALEDYARPFYNCSLKEGEDRIWCLMYNAKTPDECHQIDDKQYPDYVIFCLANAKKDAKTCAQIGDDVVRRLCVKTV
jgi:hypothetical protein